MAILPITTGNFYAPAQGIQPGGGPQVRVPGQAGGVAADFGSYFRDAISELEGLEAQKAQDAYLLSIGEIDDIAQIELTSQKAMTIMTMMVQVRNQLVEGYNELIRMNI